MSRHNSFIFNSEKKPLLKFLGKCLILMIFLFLFCFKIIMPQYLYGFNAAILDKVERAENIESPKIILVGNSNLVFGIDSEMIEEEIGMPVVNLGLHAGLGNAFLDNMAPYYVKEGDIVIYCHTEYADDDRIMNEELAWITIENHFSIWKFLNLKDIPGMIVAYPSYLKDCVELWLSGEGNRKTGEAYTREFFNEYGDNIYPRLDQQMVFEDGQIKVPEINDLCIRRMNQINDKIQEKGATMIVASYPIVLCPYTPPTEDYAIFQEQLESVLTCEVISDFTDYMIDEKYFFDSAYHLNDEGVQIRTKQLIRDIEKWQEEKFM